MKPTLRRTALRPFQRKDFDTYHRLLTNKQVLEFVKSGNASLSECQSEFERILRVTPSLFKCYHFSITLASQDMMIGMIQVGFSDLWQEWEYFCLLLPEFWGRGLATEALKRLISEVLPTINVETVLADVNPANRVAEALVRRLGFTYLGVRRDASGGNHSLWKATV